MPKGWWLTMTNRHLLLWVAVMAAVLLGFVCIWPRHDRAVPESQSATVDQVATRSPEAWVEALAEAGTGHVHTRDRESAPGIERTYRTLGPLSDAGRAALLGHLRNDIARLERDLEIRMARADAAKNDLQAYHDDLGLLMHLQLLQARHELVEKGIYITLPLSGNTSDSVPPEPPGVDSAWYGAFELKDSSYAQVMIWVEAAKREAIIRVHEALLAVVSAQRESWLSDFNARSPEDRRAWLDRYQALMEKMAAGVSGMGREELAELMAMQGAIRHFGLEFRTIGATAY